MTSVKMFRCMSCRSLIPETERADFGLWKGFNFCLECVRSGRSMTLTRPTGTFGNATIVEYVMFLEHVVGFSAMVIVDDWGRILNLPEERK